MKEVSHEGPAEDTALPYCCALSAARPLLFLYLIPFKPTHDAELICYCCVEGGKEGQEPGLKPTPPWQRSLTLASVNRHPSTYSQPGVLTSQGQ